MGKSFISAKTNHIEIKEYFNKIKNGVVIEASEEFYFSSLPLLKDIDDIEIEDNNETAIIRLKNNNYVVLEGDFNV